MLRNHLIITGILFIIVGLLYPYIKKLGLGRLPGDIFFQISDWSFYFPIASCIIVSVIITIFINIFK
ncbi:MAG: DUF2905 domain-containing protein [Legionellales bacterium]|nr:DUF2905 domain-containing protein [Legionellales bacterium]